MINSEKPVARRDGLVTQDTPEELLVYDLEDDRAHALNKTSASVWKACDGTLSVPEIADQLSKDFGESVDEDLVWLAIDQLSQKNLLQQQVTTQFSGQTRREVIRKIGLAAVVALPIVSSLAAPTSVMASLSCQCTSDAECNATACPCTTFCNGNSECAPAVPGDPFPVGTCPP